MEHNKYDQIPLSLFYQLQRVLPLADTVAEEIVCEETDILEEIIPRMFKVMQSVAKYSCDYVRRGHLGGRLLFLHFACADDSGCVGGLVHPGAIEEIERDLTKVVKDFKRVVNADVEALRRIKRTGEYLSPTGVHSQLSL